ncbi:unnamed protein product [Clonostachys rhizophaga]|uniref:GYF domain-containing protein n=1 Tax=Clonostachys rhizophaga TaxID=160324 RepID=A0A9N9YP11_9HYPO|nr:unnamed protein product [Clonostachys rhizophaga]
MLTSATRSRRDGRSANGTLTLRRSSTTPLSQSSQTPAPVDNAVQPPSAEPSAVELSPARYSKEDLLDMYRPQRISEDPSRLFMQGWNPGHVNGGAVRAWGKSNENHVPQEPGACWDVNGESTPMGHQGLTSDEKEAFMTEINSPLKPPTGNNNTNNPGAVNGRKPSFSHGSGNSFAVSSPSSATRPGTRRRETLDSNPFSPGGLNSPTTTRNRDDSFWYSRRSTDIKEAEVDESAEDQGPRDPQNKLPFGNLIRANTTGGTSGMGSIWSASTPTTPSGGSFGNFAIGSAAVGTKPAAGPVGGSRLAHLIPKDQAEAAQTRQGEGQGTANQQSWRSRQRTDTDPFGEDGLSGSAVLGGAQDTAASISQTGRVGTLGTPVKGSTGDFGMAGLNLGGDENDPVSPSETNPYRSPPAERHDQDDDESSGSKQPIPFPLDQSSGFNPLQQRGFGPGSEGADRSQTSSAKGFPISHMSAWGAPGPSGTPDRERANFPGAAFSPAIFNSMNDIQSPTLGNLNNVFGPAGNIGTGSIGRGSKLGSLFPAAMQAQMQSHEHEGLGDSGPDLRQANPLGAIGRSNFPGPIRDTESPMRSNRGVFEELFPSSEATRSQALYGSAEPVQPGGTSTAPQSFTPVSGGMNFGGAGQNVIEPPSAQARTMVMPDRMRWVYLDPQGQIQGPFTGLEMNDWYKAHFFTPDLRVKKVEDPEFEPLGQLIRRIGNSREPFLVPQVGIPHGPPSQASGFPGAAPGSVVPPLSGVFPSFGRTLTAEEQNNLERRKQEEQYLMAQQREFVMRQQAMSRFQGQQQPGLQHHSSAHSLQSQPSFGSITSPIGMPGQIPQQAIGAIGPNSTGFFDSAAEGSQPGGPSLSGNEEPSGDELAHLSATERQIMTALQAGQPPNQVPGALAQEVDLRSGLPDTDQLGEDPEGFRERLKEFEDLRAQHDAEQAAQAQEVANELAENEPTANASATNDVPAGQPVPTRKTKTKKKYEDFTLSLTQQVQKTQAAVAAAQFPVEVDMPMPFPPPASTTPLPAPTAQRARSHLPEQYSRSQSGSPNDEASNAPPPLAPWAKEPGNDAHKGPSLKEIQEAEARKAAKAEEAAAALRKAALEQEAALLREKEKQAVAATTAGLPATSTWGHVASPVAATSSPWAKPGAVKVPAPGLGSVSTPAGKKTLAEIQQEEERRKQKAKDAAVQSGAAPTGSKSYANLAGKPGQPPMLAIPAAASTPPGAGWAVVGAGGKAKASPAGPTGQARSVSVNSPKTPVAATVIKSISRSGPASSVSNAAMDEFRKWVTRELSRGITGVTDIAAFASTLDAFPADSGLIADAVYANSTTMDGRHFAEEYVRRKKLAEKGVAEKQPSVITEVKAGGSGGGWSEVAKKSSTPITPTAPKDDIQSAAGFKVVPSRKKGKK